MNANPRIDEGSLRGRLRHHEPMSRHSTWRCGGPARVLFEPADRDDLGAFLRLHAEDQVMWLGLGSNLLVRDGGIDCALIATQSGLSRAEWTPDGLLYAEAGVTCARLARLAANHDRAGLEFLAGIPGTLGGALRMNAGALGGEIWSYVVAVESIDAAGTVRRREAAEYRPGYRHVDGPAEGFVSAWLRLPDSAGGGGAERIRAVLAQRGATQPTGKASCGSVFVNPPGDYAYRLIEQCGLKGYRIGGAVVSPQHANFIVNDGGASAADIEALIEHLRAQVLRRFGVALETEVQIAYRASADASGEQP